jgi:excisionase family DNA binding protein
MMLGPRKKIGPAAEYMGGVSKRKVREWVKSGKLGHRRVDGILYFSLADMDAFMMARAVDTPHQEKINAIVDEVMEGLNPND